MSIGVQEADESEIHHGSGRQGRHRSAERLPDQLPSRSRRIHFQLEFDIALVMQIDAQRTRSGEHKHEDLKNAQDSCVVAKKPDYENHQT